MKRKATIIQLEVDEAAKKLAELEDLKELAIQEEKEKIEKAEAQIREIAESTDSFCGVVIDKVNLISILDLALRTNENIRIPFKLYPNND